MGRSTGAVVPLARWTFTLAAMEWTDVVEKARQIGWTTYIGTTDQAGQPHVAVVAPGFSDDGHVWFVTRSGTKKLANLRKNPKVGMHWPIGGQGPGELFVRGVASVLDRVENQRIWNSGIFPYDLSEFWKGPDDPDLVFVDITAEYATFIDGTFTGHRWYR